MSEQNVLDQLADYGEWIKESTAAALTPPSIDDDPKDQTGQSAATGPPQYAVGSVDLDGELLELDLPPDRQATSVRTGLRLRHLVLAASALVILIATLVPGGSQQTVLAASEQDPPGPLYVLPPLDEPAAAMNGFVREYEVDAQRVGISTVIVGSSDGDIYELATITIDPELPDMGIAWETVDLASGPAQLAEGFVTVVAQERGDEWLVVVSGRDRATFVTGLLNQAFLDADGSIRLAQDNEFDVLETVVGTDSSYTGSTTYYELATEEGREAVVVETTTATTPLIGAGVLGGQMTATRVQGTLGWHVTRQDPDGQWNGVAWQATPNRVIAVSGHIPFDEVLAIAEALEVVDEQTWQNALPGFWTE